MKSIVRILGLAMALTALLVISIAGTVFAANGPNGDCELPGPYGAYEGDSGPNGPNGDCE